MELTIFFWSAGMRLIHIMGSPLPQSPTALAYAAFQRSEQLRPMLIETDSWPAGHNGGVAQILGNGPRWCRESLLTLEQQPGIWWNERDANGEILSRTDSLQLSVARFVIPTCIVIKLISAWQLKALVMGLHLATEGIIYRRYTPTSKTRAKSSQANVFSLLSQRKKASLSSVRMDLHMLVTSSWAPMG